MTEHSRLGGEEGRGGGCGAKVREQGGGDKGGWGQASPLGLSSRSTTDFMWEAPLTGQYITTSSQHGN